MYCMTRYMKLSTRAAHYVSLSPVSTTRTTILSTLSTPPFQRVHLSSSNRHDACHRLVGLTVRASVMGAVVVCWLLNVPAT